MQRKKSLKKEIPESQIQECIKFDLEQKGFNVIEIKNKGSRFVKPGVPDLIAFGSESRFIACENKKYDGKKAGSKAGITDKQMSNLQDYFNKGAYIAAATRTFKNYNKLIKCPRCKRIRYGDLCFYCNIIKE